MKQKDPQNDGQASSLASFFSMAITPWFSLVKETIKETILRGVDKLVDHIENRAIILQKKLIQNIISATCAIAGIVFLTLSLSFYLRDVLKWNIYSIFLIIGVILFIVAAKLVVKTSRKLEE